MASIAKFDTWQNSAGVAYNTVIKSYSAIYTAKFQIAGNTSWTNIPSLSVTLTPSSVNSKFLLLATVNGVAYDDGGYLRFSGGNAANAVGDTAGSRWRTFSGIKYRVNPIDMKCANMIYLDAPATTSSVTYSVQVATDNDATTINASDTDSDSGYYPRGASTFVVLEVAG